MASTFSDLGIELMSTGENAGTWGDKTNTNLQIVEKAIAGYVEKSIAGGAQTTALSITDGTTTESDSIARHAVIKLTGSITGNQIVTVPDSIEKVYIITNGTSGAYTVQFKTASGTGITFGVSEKTTRLVYSDGTNLVDAGFGGALDIEGRELVLDADGDTSLTADTDDQIDIKIGGTDQIKLVDGAIVPVTDNDIDLGTSSLEFKDAFFDGTVTSDAFAGPLTGNVTGNVSGTAATVTTAAQSNITSLGTLTTLTVDNIITNGSTIGHTSDTDLITLADGIATVAGEVSMTTLDIGGTNVTSTASELNLLDGRDATHLAVPGKFEGTNFTGGLLIGHTTTGTLNGAQSDTGVGIEALDAITSGDENTAVGYRAATVITTGSRNTAIGSSALKVMISGTDNTAIGKGSLVKATGSFNTAIGESSGDEIVGGSHNLTIGNDSGDNITSGDGNVIIGSVDAGSASGDRQLKIAGYDGSTTTTWISGDSNGIVTFADDILIKDDGTIGSASAATAMTIEASGQVNFVSDINVADDIFMSSDSAQFTFGANSEIRLQHVHNAGLQILNTATGDDSTVNLTLATDEADIAVDDIIGIINFQAPSEGTGTDSRLVAASIAAVSEGDFAADNNATKLSFRTAASEAAAEKMSLSSAGVLTVSSTITADSKDVILGKFEGTNFTNSLLIGHSTTGTLNAANNNIGIGHGVFTNLTSGDNNTGVGVDSLSGLVYGVNNTGFGANTLKNNSVGSSNTGIGYQALEAMAGGNGSTAVGSQALKTALASYNTAVGVSAGEGMVGQDSHNNLVLGYQSGDNITTGSGNVIIGSVDAAAADSVRTLKIAGYDGSTTTTWISGDSDGDVTFAHDVILANDSFVQFGDAGEKISGDGTDLTITSSGNTTIESDNITIDAASSINLDAGGASINLKSNGTKFAVFTNDSSHFAISADISDKDIRFKGSDGGSVITALTLDMSDAGTAIFNHDLVIADAGFIGSASDTDAIAIASNGVVTFSQTPVNSAGAAFVTDDPTALAIALG